MVDVYSINHHLMMFVKDTFKTCLRSARQGMGHSWRLIREVPSDLRNHPQIAVILIVDAVCFVVFDTFVNRFNRDDHDQPILHGWRNLSFNMIVMGGLTYGSLYGLSHALHYLLSSYWLIALSAMNVALHYLLNPIPSENQESEKKLINYLKIPIKQYQDQIERIDNLEDLIVKLNEHCEEQINNIENQETKLQEYLHPQTGEKIEEEKIKDIIKDLEEAIGNSKEKVECSQEIIKSAKEQGKSTQEMIQCLKKTIKDATTIRKNLQNLRVNMEEKFESLKKNLKNLEEQNELKVQLENNTKTLIQELKGILKKDQQTDQTQVDKFG